MLSFGYDCNHSVKNVLKVNNLKLFIDDTRPVPYGFILARSVQEALNDKHQLFEQISKIII
ncbi:hypothetical protein [Bacillus sp. AFS041924]|uniref:hypothetical protein n=1 Tax=Bacillus sp. AFS041924 TaxID=2033503 RepID=UPI0011458354|nr:hypothetical protein [Bacillus sp. AFS041924]